MNDVNDELERIKKEVYSMNQVLCGGTEKNHKECQNCYY